jgi:hypothetical protein
VLVLGNGTLGLEMYICMRRRRAEERKRGREEERKRGREEERKRGREEERKRGREEDRIFALAVGPGYDSVLLLGKRMARLWNNGLYMDMVGACWWMCIGNRDGW